MEYLVIDSVGAEEVGRRKSTSRGVCKQNFVYIHRENLSSAHIQELPETLASLGGLRTYVDTSITDYLA